MLSNYCKMTCGRKKHEHLTPLSPSPPLPPPPPPPPPRPSFHIDTIPSLTVSRSGHLSGVRVHSLLGEHRLPLCWRGSPYVHCVVRVLKTWYTRVGVVRSTGTDTHILVFLNGKKDMSLGRPETRLGRPETGLGRPKHQDDLKHYSFDVPVEIQEGCCRL